MKGRESNNCDACGKNDYTFVWDEAVKESPKALKSLKPTVQNAPRLSKNSVELRAEDAT